MVMRMLHDEADGHVTYLLEDAEAGEAVLIDPRSADRVVLSAMLQERRLRLRWVLRTHEHDALLPAEAERLRDWPATVVQGRPCAQAYQPADGDILCFGNEHIRVLHTPGHTPHCLSFVWRDRVFCGDLLAWHACPLQPLPAQPAALWDSVVQRIFALPDETLLYARHGRRGRVVSTVLQQRRWHPQFALSTRDEFLAQMAARAPRLHTRPASTGAVPAPPPERRPDCVSFQGADSS